MRDIIEHKGFARAIEAHGDLSAIVAETPGLDVGGSMVEYDSLWVSSLTDSAGKDQPDRWVVGKSPEGDRTTDSTAFPI